MRPFQNTGRATVGAVFGAVALVTAILFTPSPASASIPVPITWAQTFDLGTLDQKTEQWDPATNGRLQGRYGIRNGDSADFSGKYSGASGGYISLDQTRGPFQYHPGRNTFQNNYTFSLAGAASLKFSLKTWGITGVDTAFETPLIVSLKNTAGVVSRYTVSNISLTTWETVWGNLESGTYTLSIEGRLGNLRRGNTHYVQGYDGAFEVGAASPGDVPLPGALILLGTAVAGAGVYGRRMRSEKKTA